MSKLKAIIVDDEATARSVLINLLSPYQEKIEVVASCPNLPEAVKKIKALQPHVVFLDVQMPHYAGYEIASFFDEMNFEIIFITAYDHYAIKAFEINAMDYLVKPVDRNRLHQSIEKLETTVLQKEKLIDYQLLLDSIQQQEFKQIIIPELGNKRIIPVDDIIAIEADGAYSKLHLTDDRLVTTSKNLKYFDQILTDHPHFFRTHRTWIIHVAHVQSVNKTHLTLQMSNQMDIKISRTRLADFEKAI